MNKIKFLVLPALMLIITGCFQSKQVDLMGLNLVKTEFCKQAQIILTIIRINIVLTGIASAYLGFLLVKS